MWGELVTQPLYLYSKIMKEKYSRIGDHVMYSVGNGMEVECVIVDFKNTFGRDRWLLEPVNGAGAAWVENYKEIKSSS